jgi:hypothetical protein
MSDKTRTIARWPRLLDVRLAAQYYSVGESTIRDYISDKILQTVELPGSTLRDKRGNVITRAGARIIAKILIDREDLDRLINERKAALRSRAMLCHRYQQSYRVSISHLADAGAQNAQYTGATIPMHYPTTMTRAIGIAIGAPWAAMPSP